MSNVFNFSAGPSVLPKSVLKQAQEELVDWRGSGMSVMEMSHRGDCVNEITEQAESDLRELLNIPNNYRVLFLQGGASSQFAMVPMNLLRGKRTADYVETGSWSKKAIAEAKRYADVNVVATAKEQNYTTVPNQAEWRCSEDAAYLHYTPNETIGGVEFNFVPEVAADVPLVADMSSTILSRPIDVSKFGVIYAGAQKNIGPSGLTIVIVREDLLGDVLDITPTMYNYAVAAENQSKYNTPPVFAWYVAGLTFKWLKSLGGLEAMAAINERKATKLYSFIDNSDFYHNPVDTASRSWMNVPFILKNSDLDKTFLTQAKENNLFELKGHRSVGGMRASIYNAMPEEGVDALIAFMKEFEQNNT